MKPEDCYITNGIYPDGTRVFHLWLKDNDKALTVMSYPLASNTDRAVLERAIEHLCAEQPG